MKRAAIVVCLLLFLCPPLVAQSPIFSLWADEERTSSSVEAGDWEQYQFYIFLDPGPDGAFAAEYRIAGVDGHICISSVPNTVVSGAVLGTPYGPPGISAGFISCQTEPVWIYRYTVLAAPPNEPGFVSVEPHADTGFRGIAICPGDRPLLEASFWNYLEVNGYYCGSSRPVVQSVEVVDADSIVAVFSPCPEPVFLIHPENFILYSITEPPETIQVIPPLLGDCLIPLRLQGTLVPDTPYMFEAIDLCGLGWYICCGSSSTIFSWVPTATLLASWTAGQQSEGIRISWTLSSVDEGIAFDVLRSDGGGFAPVGSVRADPGVLDYEYLDGGALPSGAYTYRVEYENGAERRVLFETGAIEIAPLPAALEQNHPNPFNPTTRIGFSLPAAGEVSLDVFDAAGRHIRTILRGTLPAGRHEAAWDGFDDNGRAVPSGVYFTRLRAQKTVLSRKMVLLR